MVFTAFFKKIFCPPLILPIPDEGVRPQEDVDIPKEKVRASEPVKRLVICENGMMTIIGAYYPLPDIIHMSLDASPPQPYSLFKVMTRYGLYRKTLLLDVGPETENESIINDVLPSVI